jgi:hypothetical protein
LNHEIGPNLGDLTAPRSWSSVLRIDAAAAASADKVGAATNTALRLVRSAAPPSSAFCVNAAQLDFGLMRTNRCPQQRALAWVVRTCPLCGGALIRGRQRGLRLGFGEVCGPTGQQVRCDQHHDDHGHHAGFGRHAGHCRRRSCDRQAGDARHQVDGGGSLHPSTDRCLVTSPESVDAATGFITARRQGRTRTGAAVVIRRDEHLHRGTGLVATDETAPERPDMRLRLNASSIAPSSPRWPIALHTAGMRGSSPDMSGNSASRSSSEVDPDVSSHASPPP